MCYNSQVKTQYTEAAMGILSSFSTISQINRKEYYEFFNSRKLIIAESLHDAIIFYCLFCFSPSISRPFLTRVQFSLHSYLYIRIWYFNQSFIDLFNFKPFVMISADYLPRLSRFQLKLFLQQLCCFFKVDQIWRLRFGDPHFSTNVGEPLGKYTFVT